MNVVLLPPCNGWSRLQIGSWSDRLSYVDDPAVDLLHAVNDHAPKGTWLVGATR